MDHADETTCILGSEWDDDLLAALRHAVQAVGGIMTRQTYSVVGSQEIITYQLDLPDGKLNATAETFAGLSISGPALLVDKIRLHMRS